MGIMEKVETRILGYIGIMEKKMETRIPGYMGIMEKKMESTVMGYKGFTVYGAAHHAARRLSSE